MIPQPATDLFRPYLLSGERVLWTGRPKQGLVLSGRDAWLIPLSLLWGGFAILWNIGVWNISDAGGDIGWFLRLWGLPFLIVSLYLIVGRFFHDALIRRWRFYSVTDQRLLVLRGVRASNLISLGIRCLPMLELSEYSDGTGTIAFEEDWTFSPFFFQRITWWVPNLFVPRQFFRIEEPRQVYELIQNQSHA